MLAWALFLWDQMLKICIVVNITIATIAQHKWVADVGLTLHSRIG
jgi:hypothetical protein